jgi:hypothetical protein
MAMVRDEEISPWPMYARQGPHGVGRALAMVVWLGLALGLSACVGMVGNGCPQCTDGGEGGGSAGSSGGGVSGGGGEAGGRGGAGRREAGRRVRLPAVEERAEPAVSAAAGPAVQAAEWMAEPQAAQPAWVRCSAEVTTTAGATGPATATLRAASARAARTGTSAPVGPRSPA